MVKGLIILIKPIWYYKIVQKVSAEEEIIGSAWQGEE